MPSFRSLFEDKENQLFLEKNMVDTKVEKNILLSAVKESTDQMTPAVALDIVKKINQKANIEIKKWSDRKNALREIFAEMHAVLDKEYQLINEKAQNEFDQIDNLIKEIKDPKASDAMKASLREKVNVHRRNLSVIKEKRTSLFDVMDVIAKAHDSQL